MVYDSCPQPQGLATKRGVGGGTVKFYPYQVFIPYGRGGGQKLRKMFIIGPEVPFFLRERKKIVLMISTDLMLIITPLKPNTRTLSQPIPTRYLSGNGVK